MIVARDLDPVSGASDYDLFVMKASGAGERNVTNSPGIDEFDPEWSPDGGRIAFVSDRDARQRDLHDEGERLARAPADVQHGDGEPELVTRRSPDRLPGAAPSTPSMSSRCAPTAADRTQLTFDPAPEGRPVWSPDGRQLAFTSGRDGGFDIFTMRADGRHQVNLTRDSAFDIAPDW